MNISGSYDFIVFHMHEQLKLGLGTSDTSAYHILTTFSIRNTRTPFSGHYTSQPVLTGTPVPAGFC